MSNEKMKSMFAIVTFSDGTFGLKCQVLEVHKPRSQAGAKKLLNAFQKQKQRLLSSYEVADSVDEADELNCWFIMKETTTEIWLTQSSEGDNIMLQIQQVLPDAPL